MKHLEKRQGPFTLKTANTHFLVLHISHRDWLSSLEDKLGGELVDDFVPIVNLSLQPPVAQWLVLQNTRKRNISVQNLLTPNVLIHTSTKTVYAELTADLRKLLWENFLSVFYSTLHDQPLLLSWWNKSNLNKHLLYSVYVVTVTLLITNCWSSD